MAAHPLVAECVAHGLVLEPDGPDGLAVEPAELLTDELRARLVAAKAEVLAALRSAAVEATPVPVDRLERTVGARLEAYVGLLERRGYRGGPRLLVRARRELGQALGHPSLRAARRVLGDAALIRAAELLDEWTVSLAEPVPLILDAPGDEVGAAVAADALLEDSEAPGDAHAEIVPDADAVLERGRYLLERLRWTGRHVGLDDGGALVIRPRLGTADEFGRAVAACPDDIARALGAETAGDAP